MKNPILAIILPCYNEEEVLPISIPKLKTFLNEMKVKKFISDKSFLCFVDDGSRDKTWNIIKQEAKDEHIKAIKFSKNFGHQSAILAGMMEYKGEVDCVVTIDVDLQDDLTVIEAMVTDFKAGNQIVYGVREKRKSDTLFKKWTALLFYKILKMTGIESIYNHADFRLVGYQALESLSQFREKNLYLRGLFPVLGFNTSVQYYDRKQREAGETKYTFRKMSALAWNGITSFSTRPLKIAIFFGWIAILVSIGLVIWAVHEKLTGNTISGWTSTVIPIYFIGGVQLLFLGIIGEYIGKIYLETKQRPRYIIEEKL